MLPCTRLRLFRTPPRPLGGHPLPPLRSCPHEALGHLNALPQPCQLEGGGPGKRYLGAVPAAPLSGPRSSPGAASGVSPVGPPPTLPRYTWLRSSIFVLQEAPSERKAERSPGGREAGGGKGSAGPRGGRWAEEGEGRAAQAPALLWRPGFGPGRPACPSRYTRGKVFPRPLPASPRLPASPAPASAGGAPLCQTVSTLCKDKDQREEEEESEEEEEEVREGRGDVSWEGGERSGHSPNLLIPKAPETPACPQPRWYHFQTQPL